MQSIIIFIFAYVRIGLSVEMYSVITFDMVVFLFTLLFTLKASLHAKTLGMSSNLHTHLLKYVK